MFFTLFFATIILLFVYIKIKYFTLRGPIPGSPPHFLFGNLIESGRLFGDKTIAEGFLQFKKRFGDVYQFWLGSAHVIVVGNINDVEHIFHSRNIYDQGEMFVQRTSVLYPDGLNCLVGDAHKRHAAVTTPLFRRGKIVSNLELIVECTDKLLNNWRKETAGKIHTDIVQKCENLLLSIFGFIAFDYDLETLNDDGNESNNEFMQALTVKLNTFQIVSFSPRFLSKIYVNLSPAYKRAQAIINKYLNQMTEKELNESPEFRAERKRTCLIASLIDSLQQDEKAEAIKDEHDKKGLSRSEVFNETVFFLVAGFETTSTMLAWFIYLMSKNPEIQQKIKKELMKDGDNQQLTLEQLDSLVYLDCVVKELLRFRPPLAGVLRTLTVDDRLPESGFQLHKGDSVFIPTYNLGHDSRYWSVDPEIFYPDRFLNEDKNHHPCALLAFGGGHRACIGQDLARFELKVIAARLMQYVTFSDGGAEVNAGGFTTKFTMKPKKVGIKIEFDRVQ